MAVVGVLQLPLLVGGALACTAGQGFVWARPMPADQLGPWLVGHRGSGLRVGNGIAGPAHPARPRRPLDARVPARMLEMQAEGASLHTIAAALNAEGVPTSEGRRWHARSVARAVQALLADDTPGSAG